MLMSVCVPSDAKVQITGSALAQASIRQREFYYVTVKRHHVTLQDDEMHDQGQ